MAVVAAAAVFCIVAAYKHHQKGKRLMAQNTLAAKWPGEESDDVVHLDAAVRSEAYEGPVHDIEGNRGFIWEQRRLDQTDRGHRTSTTLNDRSYDFGQADGQNWSDKVIA